MIILKNITPNGELLNYMVKLQKKKQNPIYFRHKDLDVIKSAVEKHWDINGGPTNKNHRELVIEEKIIYGKGSKRRVKIPKEGVKVNGCIIVPSSGRCKEAYKCPDVDLCLKKAINWPGWKRISYDPL